MFLVNGSKFNLLQIPGQYDQTDSIEEKFYYQYMSICSFMMHCSSYNQNNHYNLWWFYYNQLIVSVDSIHRWELNNRVRLESFGAVDLSQLNSSQWLCNLSQQLTTSLQHCKETTKLWINITIHTPSTARLYNCFVKKNVCCLQPEPVTKRQKNATNNAEQSKQSTSLANIIKERYRKVCTHVFLISQNGSYVIKCPVQVVA